MAMLRLNYKRSRAVTRLPCTTAASRAVSFGTYGVEIDRIL